MGHGAWETGEGERGSGGRGAHQVSEMDALQAMLPALQQGLMVIQDLLVQCQALLLVLPELKDQLLSELLQKGGDKRVQYLRDTPGIEQQMNKHGLTTDLSHRGQGLRQLWWSYITRWITHHPMDHTRAARVTVYSTRSKGGGAEVQDCGAMMWGEGRSAFCRRSEQEVNLS